MKDEVFGDIKYQDGAWVREETIEVYGTNRDITIEIRANSKDDSLEVQKKAYSAYLSKKEVYLKQMPQIFLNEYLYNYEDIKSRVEFSEGSPLLRENVSESIIVKTFAPLVILFDEKGNYGWICKCGWTKDKTSAILLSESEPRILTPDQLRNLNKINDDTFGLLVHDGMQRWLGLEQNQFYGESGILQIEVEGGYDEEISPIQQKAYKTYLKNKETHFKALTKMMLTVYLGDEKKADAAMKVNGVTVVDKSLLPKTLYIDKEGNYGWICYSSWDDKYLGVLLSEKGLHVMRTDELLSYAIYKRKNEIVMDNVFGILFTDYMGYEKTLIVKLAGRTYTLPLTIRADDAELTDEMRSAYKQYLKLNSTLWEGVKDAMLEYYLRGYDWFSTFMEFPKELSKENVNRDNVMSLVQFKKLYISNIDGRIAWLCECPTAEEEGLAFEFTDGEIETIAQSDII